MAGAVALHRLPMTPSEDAAAPALGGVFRVGSSIRLRLLPTKPVALVVAFAPG